MFTIGGSSRGELARIGRDYDPGGFLGGRFTLVIYYVFVTFQKNRILLQSLPSGAPFGSILVPFWLHFGTLLGHFGSLSAPYGNLWDTLRSLWHAFSLFGSKLAPFTVLDELAGSFFDTLSHFFSEVYSVCSIKITSLSQSPRCGNIRHARKPHHKTWPRLRRRRGRRPQDVHGIVYSIL